MSADVPASGTNRATGDADASGPPLAPGLVRQPFAPGRYATAIARTLTGTRDFQLVREQSVASFALTLTDDGAATACRGWRYQMTNDGPDVHTDDRFEEQVGYRGRYRQVGDDVEVELTRDDQVCAPIAVPALAPSRATTVRLRCTAATAAGHPTLSGAVLVCTWLGPPSPEQAAHAVDGLGPAGTWLLGAAPGLRLGVTGAPPELVGDPTAITATTTAIPDDAWRSGG